MASPEDRLSDLPDGVLGHILSFLPTPEAGRAAVLSSRWRHVFAFVDTISFEQPKERASSACSSCYYSEADERSSLNSPFLNRVGAALLCRRLHGGGVDPPLRALRVAFHHYHEWDAIMVDRWLACATQHGGRRLHHLDLRFRRVRDFCYRSTEPDERLYCKVIDSSDEEDLEARELPNFICSDSDSSDSDDDDDDYEEPKRHWGEYIVPRRLFSCTTLRTLCLGPCQLDLPAAISLPSVETLLLTSAVNSDKDINRLISGLPRLVDLTLEECNFVRAVSVLDRKLRSLALRCCHKLVRVAVDASDLRAFDYSGAVPAPSLLALHGGAQKLSSCKIRLCGKELSMMGQFVWLRKLLKGFVGTRYLHLRSARLGAGVENAMFRQFPAFSSLRHLELTGRLQEDTVVDAMTRILEQTPILELLSMSILPHGYRKNDTNQPNKVPITGHVSIPCLRDRVREISIVHYQGSYAQRVLVKFMLCNAMVLDKFCCEISKDPLQPQSKMTKEIKSWAVSKSAKIIFL
ncbi:hypothetical protein ACP70R_002000 [Stipagrostis hirtigluma subsp. patula]